MPGRICAVASCKNNQLAFRKKGLKLIFHSFPRGNDLVSSTIRKEWVHRCKRADKFNVDASSVCFEHFTSNDYERDLQNELLNLPLRKILKKTAVPTVNLGEKIDKKEVEEKPREKRAIRKRNKEIVDGLLSSDTQTATTSADVEETLQSFSLQAGAQIDETGSANYKEKYEELLQKYNKLKATSNKKMKSLNAMLKYYKNKYYKRVPTSTNTSFIAEKILKMVLTQNQINLLTRRKKLVHWTRKEISVAFTLRYYSKKCYLYLTNSLNYPLPSLSSLRRWASQLDLTQGLLKDVILMMKLAGEDFTDFERTVVIQFDEVKVKSVQEYDVAKDQVLGPYSQMQVVQARGLFSKWKQPVYIAFNEKVTRDILLNIISELHNISYNVVACVSDCGGGNVGLWNQLQIDPEKPFFKHPNTDCNVYMFADAPHLLKLVRN